MHVLQKLQLLRPSSPQNHLMMQVADTPKQADSPVSTNQNHRLLFYEVQTLENLKLPSTFHGKCKIPTCTEYLASGYQNTFSIPYFAPEHLFFYSHVRKTRYGYANWICHQVIFAYVCVFQVLMSILVHILYFQTEIVTDHIAHSCLKKHTHKKMDLLLPIICSRFSPLR